MKPSFLFATLVLSVVVHLPVAGAADLRKYETDSFVVYSELSEKKTRKRIEEFELFRKSIHTFLSIPEEKTKTPLEIHLISGSRKLNKLANAKHLSGFFIDRTGHPLMVVGPGRNNETMYHEYIHFVVRRFGAVTLPRWYDEGLAEFYSTMTFKDGKAVIGKVPEDRAQWLRYDSMLKTNDLLAPGNKLSEKSVTANRFIGRFYATSWVMTHRILLGDRNGLPDYKKGVADYLIKYNQGEHDPDQFLQSLGMDDKAFRKDLSSYLRKRRLNGAGLVAPQVNPQISVTELSEEEAFSVNLRLHIAVRGWSEYTRTLFDKQKLPLTGELKAAQAVFEGHEETVDPDFEQTLSALAEDASLSPVGRAYLGHALYDLARKPGYGRDAMLAEALGHLEHARDHNALYGHESILVEVNWLLGKKNAAIRELSRIIQLNPASFSANALAAEYAIKARLQDNADYFVGNVLAWAHTERQREEAERLARVLKLSREADAHKAVTAQPEPDGTAEL